MDVDYFTHAWFYSYLGVNRCLDAWDDAYAAVDHAWAPTSLVADALGK
jgi:hypothetical protein